MALPQSFESPDDYFEEALNTFKQYKYLFNFANTDILVKNVLETIDIQNLEEIDVFTEGFDLKAIDDESLSHFFTKLESLTVSYSGFDEDKCLETVDVPLSLKKKHEILYLAREIKNMCEAVIIDTVVDFGSGLGYLDQRLFTSSDYNILGLECNENYYLGAIKRQKKYHNNSMTGVIYRNHRISEESDTNISEYLYEEFPKHRGFCICGLHACADLTVVGMNIFLKMTAAEALVLMPCCYHKMSKAAGSGNKFKNFPLSSSLKSSFERFEASEYLNVPFLRLAAQPPNWKESLSDLVFNLMARAVLQIYAFNHNCKLTRNKQKAVRTKTIENDFEAYIRDATNHGFTLSNTQTNSQRDEAKPQTFDLEELRSLWRNLSVLTFKKAGIFILLQNYLQPVIENFILFDRLIYLKEHGIVNCKFKKILDDKISPRCLALIASKDLKYF